MSICTSQRPDHWQNPACGTYPCDKGPFQTQCAIPIGIADTDNGWGFTP